MYGGKKIVASAASGFVVKTDRTHLGEHLLAPKTPNSVDQPEPRFHRTPSAPTPEVVGLASEPSRAGHADQGGDSGGGGGPIRRMECAFRLSRASSHRLPDQSTARRVGSTCSRDGRCTRCSGTGRSHWSASRRRGRPRTRGWARPGRRRQRADQVFPEAEVSGAPAPGCRGVARGRMLCCKGRGCCVHSLSPGEVQACQAHAKAGVEDGGEGQAPQLLPKGVLRSGKYKCTRSSRPVRSAVQTRRGAGGRQAPSRAGHGVTPPNSS